MFARSVRPFLRLSCSCVVAVCLPAVAQAAAAQDRMAPGRSIGTVTTRGKLIILTLDEDALGKPHLFDLGHRTVRFTPDGTRFRAEALPEVWDKEFGAEMKDPQGRLEKFAFPFSGRSWSSFSVGVTGSITFGEGETQAGGAGRRAAMASNHDGGLAVERYALLQRVGSELINQVPAIAVFFKPRMTGTRYLKELSDRAVVTWTLTEPYGGIQDWTWKPTVNRFQAVLYKTGVIDLTWDEVSARDSVVGIFPTVRQRSEKPIARLTFPEQERPGPGPSVKSVSLSAVDGLFLKAAVEMAAPLPPPGDAKAVGVVLRVCLSATKPAAECADGAKDATVWTIRGIQPYRRNGVDRASRYIAYGPGLAGEVSVEGNRLTIRGTLPEGMRAGQRIYVSVGSGPESQPASQADRETASAGAAPANAQPVRLLAIASPEMALASIRKEDGAFPVIYESFYYPEAPRPNDLTCSVIQALGDKFDLLAYYSDFRIDNPEAGTPSTGPLGGGPGGGEVTGIHAEQRDLAAYCTAGRFQWQFVQPVYMGANQMDEYPPDDVTSDKRRDLTFYWHQLAERTLNGKIPPYDYAMSQISHEMGHRWSAFVSAKVNGELIPLGPTHWATGLQAPVAFPYQRPVEASAMGGGVWQDNFDGTFTQLDDDYYVPATGWSYLDLYLMGLIAPSEVPDFFLLRNLVAQGQDAQGHGVYKADRTRITIGDVVAAEGPRLPDVDHAQKRFNTGMVIVLEHGHTPAPELLERVEGIRLRWMDYWETTTGHRSVMTTDPH